MHWYSRGQVLKGSFLMGLEDKWVSSKAFLLHLIQVVWYVRRKGERTPVEVGAPRKLTGTLASNLLSSSSFCCRCACWVCRDGMELWLCMGHSCSIAFLISGKLTGSKSYFAEFTCILTSEMMAENLAQQGIVDLFYVWQLPYLGIQDDS